MCVQLTKPQFATAAILIIETKNTSLSKMLKIKQAAVLLFINKNCYYFLCSVEAL